MEIKNKQNEIKPLKILFIIDSLRAGGKERRVVELLKILSNSDLFIIELIVLNKNVHYKEIFNLKFKVYLIDREKYPNFKLFFKLSGLKKQFNPSIIHAWDTLSTILSIPLTIFSKSLLITSKITDAPVSYNKISFFGFLSEICFRFSDYILANSKAGLSAYKISKSNSGYIHNGFNFNRLKEIKTESEIRKLLGFNNKFIVSMTASFSENKDYDTFLSAANYKILKDLDLLFLCVGDGPKKNYLKSKYKSDNIKFLGLRNDVESIMKISDIGVLMSNNLKHGEGISNSIMEYMANGKPVIVSNNGGNSEIVLNDETGYIIDKNCHIILSNKIYALLSHSPTLKKFGMNSKSRILNHFNIETMVYKFKDLYLELVRK